MDDKNQSLYIEIIDLANSHAHKNHLVQQLSEELKREQDIVDDIQNSIYHHLVTVNEKSVAVFIENTNYVMIYHREDSSLRVEGPIRLLN